MLLALAVPAAAQQRLPVPVTPAAPALQPAPKLLVVISVDQFSAELFETYRPTVTGGLARMAGGIAFASGYQSHAATETCPGHSTITTGDRPTRTGIIANDWVDLNTARTDKTVYCAEDEFVPGSTSTAYTVSDKHLRVPTLGERMKAWRPATRVYSVAGKDRAAVMMGGHAVDQLWWWDGKAFASYAGRAAPAAVTQINTGVAAQIAAPATALTPPAWCAARDKAIDIGGGKTVGTGRFARAAGDARGWRASPAFDGATLALAARLIADGRLGRGSVTDIISIGASATDYVGHTYGPGGLETCIQLASLDRDLGDFFRVLDRLKLDYAVVLTADHAGLDLPERARLNGVPDAQRIDPNFTPKLIGEAIAAKFGLSGQLLWGGSIGDVWIDPKLSAADRARVETEAIRVARAHPQVETILTAREIAATPLATTPPDQWTLLERARASYDPQRSGVFQIVLKKNVTPIADPTKGYVATHGSFWDYDRRVPILFWRRGMIPARPTRAIETIDIAPTLAALIALPLAAGAVDGKCLPEVAGNACR
ncbi:MAG: alkaline phosphatase family protein [Pseudomonadota bacterium]